MAGDAFWNRGDVFLSGFEGFGWGFTPAKGFHSRGAGAASLASIPASRSLSSPASSCCPLWGRSHLHPISQPAEAIAPPSLPNSKAQPGPRRAHRAGLNPAHTQGN